MRRVSTRRFFLRVMPNDTTRLEVQQPHVCAVENQPGKISRKARISPLSWRQKPKTGNYLQRIAQICALEPLRFGNSVSPGPFSQKADLCKVLLCPLIFGFQMAGFFKLVLRLVEPVQLCQQDSIVEMRSR